MTDKTHDAQVQTVTANGSPQSQSATEHGRTKRRRRMARATDASVAMEEALPPRPSKLDQIAALIGRSGGATIAELTAATGWQPHSVRGAIAGALKKRGLITTSAVVDQVRRYRAEPAG